MDPEGQGARGDEAGDLDGDEERAGVDDRGRQRPRHQREPGREGGPGTAEALAVEEAVGDYATDFAFDEKSGYFVISCVYDVLQLWYTNGTDFTYTGNSRNYYKPVGMCYDSNGRLMVCSNLGDSCSIFTA